MYPFFEDSFCLPLTLDIELEGPRLPAPPSGDDHLLPLPPVHGDGAVLRHSRRHLQLLKLFPALLGLFRIKRLHSS